MGSAKEFKLPKNIFAQLEMQLTDEGGTINFDRLHGEVNPNE
jgi:hypothetical protein